MSCRFASKFAEHVFQMLRSATNTSDKVSALQYLHIVKADLYTLLVEADSGHVLPTMKARRGDCPSLPVTLVGHTAFSAGSKLCTVFLVFYFWYLGHSDNEFCLHCLECNVCKCNVCKTLCMMPSAALETYQISCYMLS